MFSKFINKGYEAEQCEICGVEFNLLKFERIHKCKRCDKYICSKCGDHKQKILDQNGLWTLEPHRVCEICKSELNQITTLVEKNEIQWNRVSKIGKIWMNKIERDYEYQHFLKLFYSRQKNFQEDSEIIQKDVIKGRTDYTVFNYSMKQFFYIVQQGQERMKTRQNIANVLYALAARYDHIGYVQGMSGVAAFLLCFANQRLAFTIFCDLLENIFPKNFFVKNNYGVTLIGLLAETYFLKSYFVHYLLKIKGPLIFHDRDVYTEEELDKIKVIVELTSSKALLSLFVSFLAFSHVNFIWEQLAQKRTFQVIQKAFIATLYLNRQKILQKKSFRDLQTIFEAMELEEFIQAYYDVEIDLNYKNKMIEEYYEDEGKKWTDNSERTLRRLQKQTNFSKDQIAILQHNFCQKQQTIVINKEKFMKLIKIFYDILKQVFTEDQPILQITPFFVSKIFDEYNANKKQGLDFREFVCCFSICTKGQLKDRMIAIINTFQDKNKKISYDGFKKLISSLCSISPPEIEDKKEQFLQRMRKYFHNQTEISISELHILLNDDFINELTIHIKSDAPGIIEKSVKLLLNE